MNDLSVRSVAGSVDQDDEDEIELTLVAIDVL